MKLDREFYYDVVVNEKTYCYAVTLDQAENTKRRVISHWENAQKYGNGFWFEKAFPIVNIEKMRCGIPNNRKSFH